VGVSGQDLLSLTQCYSNIDIPDAVDESVDRQEAVDQAVLRFGAAARAGVHMPSLQAHILANLEHVPATISHEGLTELFWFLFSQKAWLKMDWLSKRFALRLPELPGHVADLCFLAFYRMQRELVLSGRGVDAFVAASVPVMRRIERAWPQEADRHDAFAAMIKHIRGDFDGARASFSRIDGARFIEPFAGISSARMASPESPLPSCEALDIRPCGADHVTLISVDEVYFKKFAYLVARRYLVTNPRNGLHFHCVGFDPFETIHQWKLPVAVGVTIDDVDLGSLTIRQKRGYFAGARYLYLSRYLELYRSVFVADIDGHLSGDVGMMNDEYAAADVILNAKVLDAARELHRLPWEAIPAGIFMVRGTVGGCRFAKRMGSYLHSVIQQGMEQRQPLWYADQVALFYTWLDLRDEVRFASFGKTAFIQKGSWQLFAGDRERLEFMTGE
jgi:hypothetical protein